MAPSTPTPPRVPAVPRSADPATFAQGVASTLFAWDTASGLWPLDYTSAILAVGDPSGDEQAGLASDVAVYLPTRDAWIELRQYATRQHLTIDSAYVPDAWADAVAQAQPGQLAAGTTAVTIEGTRRRAGVWNGQPVISEHPVAFTMFMVCAPSYPTCHLLRRLSTTRCAEGLTSCSQSRHRSPGCCSSPLRRPGTGADLTTPTAPSPPDQNLGPIPDAHRDHRERRDLHPERSSRTRNDHHDGNGITDVEPGIKSWQRSPTRCGCSPTPALHRVGNYPNDGNGGDHDSPACSRCARNRGARSPVDGPTDARAFFGGPTGPNYPSPRGLLDIPGWQQMDPGEAAQAVEVSAYPDRYRNYAPIADSILAALTNVGSAAGGVGGPAVSSSRVVFPLPEGTWVLTSPFAVDHWRTEDAQSPPTAAPGNPDSPP